MERKEIAINIEGFEELEAKLVRLAEIVDEAAKLIESIKTTVISAEIQPILWEETENE